MSRVAAPSAPSIERSTLRGPFGHPAIPIGRLWNIQVGLDWSWLVILALVTLAAGRQLGAANPDWTGPETWGAAVLASLLFFTSILLHELGHSVTSNRLGLPVRSITLFLFGGLAKLGGTPARPRDQLLIGLAGPLVSVALGGAFLGLAWLLPEAPRSLAVLGAVASWLGTVNLILAAFNLFPGYPLDGGHVLRALVWAATGNPRLATSIAGALGVGFAFFLIGVGSLALLTLGAVGGFWLVLIGLFVMRAARGSAYEFVLTDRLGAIRADEALAESCPTVDPHTSVHELVHDAVLKRGERQFCIEKQGKLLGLVTLHEIRKVEAGMRAVTPVSAIMIPLEHLAVVSANASLWDALKQMDDLAIHQIPVVEDGHLIGLLTREQLLRVVRNQMILGGGD